MNITGIRFGRIFENHILDSHRSSKIWIEIESEIDGELQPPIAVRLDDLNADHVLEQIRYLINETEAYANREPEKKE